MRMVVVEGQRLRRKKVVAEVEGAAAAGWPLVSKYFTGY